MNPGETKIEIDYDDKLAAFIVRCPFYANDLIAGLPAKRWDKPRRGWRVPPVRKNVEFITQHLVRFATVTPAANARYLRAVKEAGARATKKRGFPAWYKFKREPRKHQKQALDKFYPIDESALYMDRGTGKTGTTIDLACAWRMDGQIDGMLVIVKLSARRTWREEFELHAPIPADVFLPYTEEKRAFERWLGHRRDFPIMVIGLESLSQGSMHVLAERFLTAYPKPLVVIDESHLISNHRAIRSIACLQLGRLGVKRMVLTGTPISTSPLNLFMQFEFLNPDIIGIGDYYAFKNQYAIMGGYHIEDKRGRKRPVQIVGYQNLDELTRTVAPYTFEVRKSDVLDLPPKVYKKVYIQLTKEQRALYDKIKKDKEYEYAGKNMVPKTVLEIALRLQQVCGGFVTTYEDVDTGPKIKRISTVHEIIPWEKNPKILELLDIADDDKQFIIWAAYKAEINAIVRALNHKFPKQSVVQIHGGVSEHDRAIWRQEYQKGKHKFMVGNTQTGGTSDTWTACETMVYFNNTEKMVDREQSEDRAHRDGLKHSVLYVDLIAEKTVDETIIRSLAMKVDLSEYVRSHIRDAARLLDGECVD